MTEVLLIIFVKKPELGKVKTRLAASIGAQRALEIYQQLLQHTHAITSPLPFDKVVYYTPEIQQDDLWSKGDFQKAQQAGGDLGERMQQAFSAGFAAGYQHIAIIGSDCYQLTTAILKEAFQQLKRQDVVIGPSKDGGYYLLGMNRLHKAVFEQKQWSTASVLEDTLSNIQREKLRHALLPTLVDIDEADDLKTMLPLL